MQLETQTTHSSIEWKQATETSAYFYGGSFSPTLNFTSFPECLIAKILYNSHTQKN